MKIGVLTLPLNDNYGGLLQAFALRTVLRSMGHDSIVIDRRRKRLSNIRKFASIAKSRMLGRSIYPKLLLSEYQSGVILKEIKSFQKRYISHFTESITTDGGMSCLNKMGFDAFVVGSDQCWRPRYLPNVRNYFLDFAENQRNIRRIAYAASFGVSHWEINEPDTRACRKLARKFDGISVREDTGVALVKKYLGRDDAVHVVDPTMLISAEQYMEIFANEDAPRVSGDLKVYILDKNQEKDLMTQQIAARFGWNLFEMQPHKRLGSEKVTDDNAGDFSYPNPVQWVRGFRDAKFVVTDSFHGVVFSILFNVPFIAIGNVNRGLARFESLLSKLGLSNRFVTDLSPDKINDAISQEIHWHRVNAIVENERSKSMDFLKKHLQ
ncbi:MAG TPA: polysaccharide pyruvyl transferase family protein [Candidatus Omnitrophota bacterium]|nr:polysaccharide pyruvyl transferase family protein [Candidatus Omnitrophota bacterium]